MLIYTDGTQSDDLREAELRVIGNDKCQKDLGMMNITSNVICAGNEKKSPCQVHYTFCIDSLY